VEESSPEHAAPGPWPTVAAEGGGDHAPERTTGRRAAAVGAKQRSGSRLSGEGGGGGDVAVLRRTWATACWLPELGCWSNKKRTDHVFLILVGLKCKT
jgi:hypothetical protein